MRLRLIFILLAILAFMLAACTTSGGEGPLEDPQETAVGEATDAATTEPEVTEAAPTVEPSPTPAAEACEELPEVKTGEEGEITVPENAVVVFQKTGGFAGITEQTVIYADGYIENDKNESYQSTPEVVAMLLETAGTAGFFELDGNYVPEGHCCDFFNYSLTIRDCEQIHTVVTADEVPGAPAELTALIRTIEEMIGNLSAAVPVGGGLLIG